jgi:hypothetical protein
VVDLNFMQNPPADPRYCEKYIDQTAAVALACQHGMSEARRLADRYAGGYGRIHGYLRGYAWGLHRSASHHENDAREIQAGRAGVDAIGDTMQAGLEAGRRDGQSRGSSQGRQDAIRRFEAALDTGKPADPRVTVPQASYAGVENAYESYVGKPRTVEDLIAKDLRPGELPVYVNWDATNLGEMRRVSIFDIFSMNGVYRFERGAFYDTSAAFQTWTSRAPVYDPDGRFRNYGGQVVTLPGQEAPVTLQYVFQDAFTYTYGYWINWFYSSQFQQNIDLGTQHGAALGEQLGKRVAQQKGLIQAYNERFRESSLRTFQDAFAASYASVFNSTFADYNNNPKLSLSLLGVIGADNDGILQPGESIRLRFRVKNLGGVGSPLSVSVRGDVINASTQQNLAINGLSSGEFTTEILGTVDPRLNSRQSAKIILVVNGIEDTRNETVSRSVQLTGTRLQLNLNQGSGTVTVTATNVATVRTAREIKATLAINGRIIDEAQTDPLQAGESRNLVLDFSRVDPLEILAGRVRIEAKVLLGETPMDVASQTLEVKNRNEAIASYFNALAREEGMVPAGTSLEAQIGAISALIVSENLEEVQSNSRGRNVFKKDPDSLLIGKLVTIREATTQTATSRAQYAKLAKALAPARKNLRNFLFFGGKRKSYDRLVSRLGSQS